MLDFIEELGKIHINAMAVAISDILLRLLDRSVSRTVGSKTETRFGESGIEDRCQDLHDGLLDYSF